MLDDLVIGPFRIDFTPDNVTFLTSDASNTHTLTYAECYQLLAALYQCRDELYKLSQGKDQPAEGPPTYVYNDVTYVINDDSISVAGWEQMKEEKKEQEQEEPPA
jgi:hypothetical protein